MHADEEKVKAFIKDRVQADVKMNNARRSRDRADLQSLQFYRGGEDNQWTVWDSSAQTYVPRPTGNSDDAALPDWFFRATTNRLATTIDGVCAILNQSQPAQEVSPANSDDKNRAAAEVAELALPILYEESGYPALRAQIHKLIALTNAVALHVYYDNDERWGMDDLPLLQCQNEACRDYHLPHDVPDPETPCPTCGTGVVDEARHPQTGLAVGMPFPRGKLCVRLFSSFEFSVPRSARELHEERVGWIAGHGRMDSNEVLGLWPSAAGHLGDNRTVSTKTANNQSVSYADQMRSLAAPGAAIDKTGGSSVSPSGPVVWFVWADPVDDDNFYFPDGLYAAMLEDELVLESGPLPLKDEQKRPVKNVLLRTFQASPGAAWGKPPADDLVPIQKQLNLCQALAFLILMNDAAPTTFIPDSVTLLDELTGMPGGTHRYQSLRAGDKPIITHGAGFPTSLQWFLEFLIDQFDKVSKLNAVLQGARPKGGDPTLGEVQILEDNGLRAFKEPLDQLVDFEKRLSKVLLWTARQSMWSPRFYSVVGDNGEWDVKQFLGADLDGSVSVQVEPSSAWPQSRMLKDLRLDKALERGLINPQDPEVQATYLSLNDLADFKKSTDEDRKQIARQMDTWKDAVDPSQITPPDPLWNLQLHFFTKVMWLRTEAAEKMTVERPPVYQAIRAHIQQLQLLMMPAAPAAPTGQAVDSAVQQGALQPAGQVPPTGQALDHAIAQGKLTPAPPPPAAGVH